VSKRPIWQKAIAGSVVAGALLLMTETSLRLAGVAPAYSLETIAGWRVAPDLRGVPIQGPRDGHSFTVTTNSAGLRTTMPEARRKGVLRVALLGDSTVFGWGVNDGGAVSDGLSRGLVDHTDEVGPVEVLNAGQPGYSTTQAAWLLREVVAGWSPDLVIHFLPLHDDNLVLVSDREVLEGGAGLVGGLRVGLARHSRIYGLFRQVAFSGAAEHSRLPDQASDGEPRVPRVSEAERARALDEMRELAGSWGGKVGVGLLPFLGDLTGHTPTDRPSSVWAAEYAARTGIRLYDVRGCCGPDGGDLVLPDDPGHLTTEGNHMVGRALAAAVAAALSVKPTQAAPVVDIYVPRDGRMMPQEGQRLPEWDGAPGPTGGEHDLPTGPAEQKEDSSQNP